MHAIVVQLRNYFRAVNPWVLTSITALTALLIVLNYSLGIERHIVSAHTSLFKFTGFFLLFAFTYCAAWLLQTIFSKEKIATPAFFYLLLLSCPLLFAGKVTFDWLPALLTKNLDYPWNQYWSIVLNWPLKGLLVLVIVAILWRWGNYQPPMSGLSAKDFSARPYFLLLLYMLPLIALAATQHDFLRVYPKWQRVNVIDPFVENSIPHKLLFELSYGLDFITIELFFRGFLVLAFVRYAGKAVILPMAAFYCSIHFGKPLLECITSYFGGIILGVVVYHSRSIWGGLIVHLGIAWLMEVAGFVGRAFFNHE